MFTDCLLMATCVGFWGWIHILVTHSCNAIQIHSNYYFVYKLIIYIYTCMKIHWWLFALIFTFTRSEIHVHVSHPSFSIAQTKSTCKFSCFIPAPLPQRTPSPYSTLLQIYMKMHQTSDIHTCTSDMFFLPILPLLSLVSLIKRKTSPFNNWF